VFTVTGKQVATDIRHTREVVVLQDPTAVPRAPAHILGVANLRGHVVPIVDIAPLLGLAPRPASEAPRPLRTVILEGGGAQVAIVTDEVLGLESFDEVHPAGEIPEGPGRAMTLGWLRRNDATATLLDVPELVETVRVRPPSRPDA
jgi:chemotaxis signal transduction protein